MEDKKDSCQFVQFVFEIKIMPNVYLLTLYLFVIPT